MHARAGGGQRLHRAIQKHGISCFEFEAKVCVESDLAAAEISEIASRGSYGAGGYNDTPGGDGWPLGRKHSAAALAKMRARPGRPGNKEYRASSETRLKLSAALIGRVVTEQQRNRLSEIARHRAATTDITSFTKSAQRPVLVWPPNSMTPLEFPSVGAAAIWAGVSKTSISNWLLRQPKNRHNQAQGCAWADISML
jgi:hypothetical protein